MVLLTFPDQNSSVAEKLVEEFETRTIQMDCNYVGCQKENIGNMQTTQFLEDCSHALVVSINRRDPITRNLIFEDVRLPRGGKIKIPKKLSIGPRTVQIHQGLPQEKTFQLSATIQ